VILSTNRKPLSPRDLNNRSLAKIPRGREITNILSFVVVVVVVVVVVMVVVVVVVFDPFPRLFRLFHCLPPLTVIITASSLFFVCVSLQLRWTTSAAMFCINTGYSLHHLGNEPPI